MSIPWRYQVGSHGDCAARTLKAIITKALWFGAAWMVLALTACASAPHIRLERFEYSQPKMGSTVTLVFYAPDQRTASAASDAAFARIDQLNAILSDYLDDSEITCFSASAGTGDIVPLSQDLYNVLTAAQDAARITDGAFDVTIGPAVRLWRRARREHKLPEPGRLQLAMQSVGYKKLELDQTKNAGRLRKEGMLLDVGGIAKGYTAAQVIQLLGRLGIKSAMVAMSGDVAVSDPPPGEIGWKVALDSMLAPGSETAQNKPGAPRRIVYLANQGVSTAGDGFQHVDIGGMRYSHIVDPKTGVGLTDSPAVHVICSDPTLADSLDTAMCVMGVERALKLADGLPGVAAIISRKMPDGTVKVYESARVRKLNWHRR